jgi:hypothetical protein
MDQHSFFFMTLMWLAAAAGTASTGGAEWTAWFLVPVWFTLGFLSGQIPVSFGALCVAGWVVAHRSRALRWISALAAGTLLVVLCGAFAAFGHSVIDPLRVGGDRTARAGLIGPVRLLAATLVHIPGWLRLWSLDLALAASLPLFVVGRSDARARMRLWLLASAIVATAGFLAYTRTLMQSGAALAMPIVALVAAGMREALPRRFAVALVAIAIGAAVRDTVVFVGTVDSPRIEHVRYDPSEADRARGRLPAGLEFMRWSRGPSPYEPDEMTALVRFLREADGNFFLIGDSSVLYGLAGKRSTSPVLWFDPGLTIPPLGSPAFSDFEAALVDRLARDHVRRIVIERPLTWTHLTLNDFPRLIALTRGGACGERLFGAARVLEFCRVS